jgi:hypothetical protein
VRAVLCTWAEGHEGLEAFAELQPWFVPGMRRASWIMTETSADALLGKVPAGSVEVEEANEEVVLDVIRQAFGEFVLTRGGREVARLDWDIATLDGGRPVVILANVIEGSASQVMMPISYRGAGHRAAHLVSTEASHNARTESFLALARIAQISNEGLANALEVGDDDQVVRSLRELIDTVCPGASISQRWTEMAGPDPMVRGMTRTSDG